jgi:hypothetical protein
LKTNRKKYTHTVPVFRRGDHPVVGVGFNYETLMPLIDVKLPFVQVNVVSFAKRAFFNTEVGTTQIWRKHGGNIMVKKGRHRADGNNTPCYYYNPATLKL